MIRQTPCNVIQMCLWISTCESASNLYEFKQDSEFSWASIFSSRKGVSNAFLVLCAQSLAHKWSMGDDCSPLNFTFQLILTFTSYVVYCLFFLYNNMSTMRADLFIWCVLMDPQCLEKCLIHLINSCWMSEWSFQRNRWALSKLLGAFCLYFRKPDHRYAKEECECP